MADNMGFSTSNSALHLPTALKLKGEENFEVWKEAMINLAKTNGLIKYIRPNQQIPKEYKFDDEDDKSTPEQIKAWEDWEAGDARMKLAFQFNVIGTPSAVIQGKKYALDCWTALKDQYEGKGNVLKYNAIQTFIRLRYDKFSSLENFIVGFKQCVEKLKTLKTAPPEEWFPWVFIDCLTKEFPI